MSLCLNLFIFALTFLAGARSENVENSSCAAARELDQQCDKHCYRIVKPLLEHARSVQWQADRFTELSNKILRLEAQLDQSNEYRKYLLTKEDLLAALNTTNSCQKESLELATQIDRKNAQITELKTKIGQLEVETKAMQTQIDNKDDHILKLTSQKALIKDLVEKTELTPIPSCFGKPTGVYQSQNSFEVSCDSSLAGAGWTVIQRRINGSVDFRRGWNEYVTGFGDPSGEFFIGLHKLHLITQSQQHDLLMYAKDAFNKQFHAKYKNFMIDGEEKQFRISSLGLYSGNSGNPLYLAKGMKFSTYDNDNDMISDNCAASEESAWWFNGCEPSLNGAYKANRGIKWQTKQLKFTQMMIRPTNLE